MVKNIVFDMGNVLVGYDADYIASQFASDPVDQAAILAAIFRHPDWVRLDAGEITDANMLRAIPERVPAHLVATARRAFCNWPDAIRPLPEADALVARLQQAGYPTYLLSNASARVFEYRDRFPSMRNHKGYLVSACERLLKPDPAIYRLLCARYGLEPAECYFIDDTLVNVEGAKALGMDGFHLSDFQYGALEADLTRKGLRF